MMKTKPFDLVVGESYSDGVSIRRVEEISLKTNTLKYIENPDGGHILGICNIMDFYKWIDRWK